MIEINSLIDLKNIDVFFIDVFGVLWDGYEFYPEGLAVCEKLIASGKKIYVLTNATMLSDEFKKKRAKKGFIQGVHYTDVITSGDVMKHQIENEDFIDSFAGKKDSKFYIIGQPNNALFENVLHRQTGVLDKADIFYIGSLFDGIELHGDFDYLLPEAGQILKTGKPVFCANPDYFAFHGDFKHVTAGSLARWFEENGANVSWTGKPYGNIYEYALRSAGADAGVCAMVGDTVRTDIVGGHRAKMKTVLLTKTGVVADEIQAGATLDGIFKRDGVVPDYLIERLK